MAVPHEVLIRATGLRIALGVALIAVPPRAKGQDIDLALADWSSFT